MPDIHWKVITFSEDADSRSIGLEVEENLAPLRAFIFEAPETSYPRVIEAALQGVGSGFNYAGVTFPEDLDEIEEPIAPDMVEVYDQFGSIQIPRSVFLQVLLDVAETSLRVMHQRGSMSTEWEQRMIKAIAVLRTTIEQQ